MIQARQLTRRFPSGDRVITIFENLDLTVMRGESLAIVGESGAGKSTLLYMLGGLDRPTSGEILFLGRDITAMNAADLAKFRNEMVGFVWQTHNLLPEFTAQENVEMPLLIRGVARSEATARATRLLDEVGLGKRKHHRSGELSGGEQQRVGLARALAGEPRLLLADEPTGNLDPQTALGVIQLLEDVSRSRQLTTVMVTHNADFAARCQRQLRLDKAV